MNTLLSSELSSLCELLADNSILSAEQRLAARIRLKYVVVFSALNAGIAGVAVVRIANDLELVGEYDGC